jgi:two-component system chemotaxis response regulator CheB
VISVLVVDDSVVVRRLIVDALGGAPDIEVVGTAANGLLAQARIDQLKPDVVTMDIEMPQMDGITAVRELRKRHPRLPVIMFSTLSAAGATATLEALAAGASDYVTKPSNVGSVAESIAAVREQLIPRIHALAARRPGAPPTRTTPAGSGGPGLTRPPGGTATPTRPVPGRPFLTGAGSGATAPKVATSASTTPKGAPPARPSGRAGGRVDVLAIGSSTGGPDALTVLLQALPTSLPVPVVVTQHMPPVFTRMFAERLDRSTGAAFAGTGHPEPAPDRGRREDVPHAQSLSRAVGGRRADAGFRWGGYPSGGRTGPAEPSSPRLTYGKLRRV